MAAKRRADELETSSAPRIRRESSKRAKLSPSAEVRSNSSEPSSCSVSEDSALRSSPPASDHVRDSSMSSLRSLDTESDSESSISTDSDSDSDISGSDEDEDEEIVTIGGPKKPQFFHPSSSDGMHDLKARIADLLPQLEAANSMLTSEAGQHSIEDVEDGEQHIEMNLGLGVLEHQDEEGGSEVGSEDDIDADDDQTDLPVCSGSVQDEQEGKEMKVMDKLKGRPSSGTRAGIQELG